MGRLVRVCLTKFCHHKLCGLLRRALPHPRRPSSLHSRCGGEDGPHPGPARAASCSSALSPADRQCDHGASHPSPPVSRVTGCGSPLFRASTSGQTSVERATEASRLPHNLVADWTSCSRMETGCSTRELWAATLAVCRPASAEQPRTAPGGAHT